MIINVASRLDVVTYYFISYRPGYYNTNSILYTIAYKIPNYRLFLLFDFIDIGVFSCLQILGRPIYIGIQSCDTVDVSNFIVFYLGVNVYRNIECHCRTSSIDKLWPHLHYEPRLPLGHSSRLEPARLDGQRAPTSILPDVLE